MRETDLDALDPAAVRRVRAGNALWPGLAAFTGVTFLVYLGVKALGGLIAVDAGFAGQMAVAAALLVLGGVALARGRYFWVEVETSDGRRRAGGMTKARQQAIVARLAPDQRSGA